MSYGVESQSTRGASGRFFDKIIFYERSELDGDDTKLSERQWVLRAISNAVIDGKQEAVQ